MVRPRQGAAGLDAQPAAEGCPRSLRARTELPKDDADYLNPASVPNYFKPLKKLFDMCDVTLPWKRVYTTYPELDNVTESRGWTKEEIAKMLLHTRDLMDRALVLVLSSSRREGRGPGPRVGGRDADIPGGRPPSAGPRTGGARDSVRRAARVQGIVGVLYYIYHAGGGTAPCRSTATTLGGRLRGREAGPSDPIFVRGKGAPVQASEKLLEKADQADGNAGQAARHRGRAGEEARGAPDERAFGGSSTRRARRRSPTTRRWPP